VIVYCRSGNRSAVAASQLKELGYTRVVDFGGIHRWPYDIE
jgi:rhodanese-related sulfurtransferase